MAKKKPKKLSKAEREAAEHKLLVAASLSRVAKRLEEEAKGVTLEAGGYAVNYNLAVDESAVNVGLPKTTSPGYEFGDGDVLVAALYQVANFKELITWAIDTLKVSKKDPELASELKAFGKVVKDLSEGRQAKLKLRTPAKTSRGARTATIAGMLLEGRIGTEDIQIDLSGDE